jgi:HK97 family phage major capsid protein
MALKILMLKRNIDSKKAELEELRKKDESFSVRESELEQAIQEAQTEEEQNTVKEEVEKFDTEKQEHEESKSTLESEIEGLEADLEAEESKSPDSRETQKDKKERADNKMQTRAKFFGLNAQEQREFVAREDVKAFLERAREMGREQLSGVSQKRGVTGADLTIPTVVLDLLRQNIMDYSKLTRRVRLRAVNGKARQTVMGAIPEAIWTEACAKLNELDFSFNQVEVDGYKVGGVVYICQATLEDSDLNLAYEIMEGMGASIGISVDKAILYGTGVKMPLGIATRLAQTSEPDNYPATARPWKNLSTTNMSTITGKTGIEFFKAIAIAAKAAKGKYSRGVKFWAMNESTYTDLLVEAMTFNAAGAIVSAQNGVMPVIGGDIDVLPDEVISDGNIVGGYGDLYLLAERSGSEFVRSDEYRFAEDQAAFKGSARYDGMPVIAEGFVAIGIGAAPATDATFPGDTANDTTLTNLTIGSETLSPTFDPETLTYAVTASAASDAITANPTQAKAKVMLAYDGKNYPNGSTIKWKADSKAHPLTITVQNGVSERTYTVNVTKSA